jgi:hypothetical protein
MPFFMSVDNTSRVRAAVAILSAMLLLLFVLSSDPDKSVHVEITPLERPSLTRRCAAVSNENKLCKFFFYGSGQRLMFSDSELILWG